MELKRILLGISILLLFSCDMHDSRLCIHNQTDESVYVIFSQDTILTNEENVHLTFEEQYITPKNNIRVYRRGLNSWPYRVESSVNEMLHLFVIKESTTTSWSTKKIIDEKMYTRIDRSLSDLEKEMWNVYINDEHLSSNSR